jgi:hypothetical protein
MWHTWHSADHRFKTWIIYTTTNAYLGVNILFHGLTTPISMARTSKLLDVNSNLSTTH